MPAQNVSFIKALPLASLLMLAACTTVPQPDGPKIASSSHYSTGTAKPYTVRGQTYYPRVPDPGHSETGIASWYGYESPNSRTADGEIFDTDAISAAHKTFPLPSIVEVTNLDNGRRLKVRVNDRGPFVAGRIMDLSRGAAKALGVYSTGTARVKVTWLGPADPADRAIAYAAPVAQPSDDGGRYRVQLGAFSQQDNAQAAADRMDEARIDQRKGLYVVYMGPYNGAAAAEGHRQDAISAGFTSAIILHAD